MKTKDRLKVSYFWFFFALLSGFWFFKFFLPFIVKNNLLIWDMAGHFYSALFTSQYLFPKIVGWNPFFFLGFAQNQFYPPLFVYLTAFFSQAIFQLEFVFKFLVLLSVFVIPWAFYFFGRTFGLNKKTAAFFMVFSYSLMFLPDQIISHNGTAGNNFFSIFNIGLVPNGFIFPLFFIYLAVLYRGILKQRYVLAAGFLAALVLSHIVVGLTAIIFSLAVIFAKVNGQSQLKVGAKLLALAFLLSAFWTVSFLTKLAYTNSIKIYLGTSAAFILAGALTIVLGFYFKHRHHQLPIIIFHSVSLLYVLVIVFDLINLRLHLNRFNFFIFIFAAYLLFYFLQLHWQKKFTKIIFYSLFAFAFFVVFRYQSSINVAGTNTIYFDSFDAADGRTAVLVSFYQEETIHVPSYLVQLSSGTEVAKGLFVESAKNSRFINDLEKELNLRSFDWGLPTDWDEIREYSLYRNGEFIDQHLSLFNINYVVSNFVFSTDVKGFTLIKPVGVDHYRPDQNNKLPGLDQPVDFQYYLYRVGDSKKFEVLNYIPENFTGSWQAWEDRVVGWFFSPNVNQVLVYNQPQLAWQAGTSNESVELISHSANWDRFSLQINAEHDVPVLIKISHFPNWQAFVAGERIPVYLASPYLMLINASGTVEFRYLPTFWDRFGLILSWFGLAWLLLGAYKFIKSKR